MTSPQPPPPLPRPGGGPPVPGQPGDCARLRALMLTLQNELRQDIAFLNQLRNNHGSAAEIAQWQETVSLKSGEVQSTRNEMEAAGCFETPPHPPPPVVFTEMGRPPSSTGTARSSATARSWTSPSSRETPGCFLPRPRAAACGGPPTRPAWSRPGSPAPTRCRRPRWAPSRSPRATAPAARSLPGPAASAAGGRPARRSGCTSQPTAGTPGA